MTTTCSQLAGTLYGAVVGTGWYELHHTVQQLHSRPPVRARGVFAIRRGRSWVTRVIAWIARLPPPGNSVDMELLISPLLPTPDKAAAETWRRAFAGHPLISSQRMHSPGMLLERMGILEMALALRVADGALEYRSQGAAVRLFGFRLPLPAWLAPQVMASEKPGSGEHDVVVSVETRLPCVGLLIGYAGTLSIMEEAQ